MHELSIAMSIIDIAADELERQGGGCIVAVHLKLGPLSGVVEEALTSAFELAREGSVLAQSTLEIESVPVVVFCTQCQSEQTVKSLQDLCCSKCGTYGSEIVRGRELEVVAMELES
ncbi:MAG: hydrogenase maturation nickel metallochaperone HypA [Pirellulales bacterium]